MIGLDDRRSLAHDIEVAHNAGARLSLACGIAGIDLRTLQRWKTHAGLIQGDGRPLAVRPVPGHALSPAERAELLRVANEPRFAAVPPARIVPMLADEGVYLASESSFERVLRAADQSHHRGRAKPPKAVRPPTTHVATAPRQVPATRCTPRPKPSTRRDGQGTHGTGNPCSSSPSIPSVTPSSRPISKASTYSRWLHE